MIINDFFIYISHFSVFSASHCDNHSSVLIEQMTVTIDQEISSLTNNKHISVSRYSPKFCNIRQFVNDHRKMKFNSYVTRCISINATSTNH